MKNREQSFNNYLPPLGYPEKKVCIEINGNRRLKYILFLLLGFVVLTSVAANPETLTSKYKIYLLGANIGEFSVEQTNNQENVIIDATTEVEIHLLFSYRIKYVQKTVYNKGVLQNAHVETYKNGKLNSTMFMNYEKGAYQLIVDGDTTIINELITYSGSLIYFNEPKTATRIFKERNVEMRQITLAGNHTYTIKDEKGKLLNKYFYENGILQHATMRHALATVELKLVND
ncbi:MAG TPA: hypothetical protein ENN90_09490 [Mariniphaga anaerophila]|uniref:Uncharacterized protein n=1 Tax=Mariniphaga anaerophila TaxID=1484053 RepID=A0A831PKQ8_9BACT|nr:hypothetical protein [Mariniphaga anaerophila]